jgi:hypothetical protein
MRIGVIGSMQFTERMLDLRKQLIDIGHDAYVTSLAEPFIGKTDEEKEVIKLSQKMHRDAMREFWRQMQGGDAVLVANYRKNNIEHYIGANTFLEMGWAHALDQRIYVLNPLPDTSYIRTEIEAMRPIVIHGDLYSIR